VTNEIAPQSISTIRIANDSSLKVSDNFRSLIGWLLTFSERPIVNEQRRVPLISFALPDAITFVAFSDWKKHLCVW
jgi:hypothetical protein